MEINERFEQAVTHSKSLASRPNNAVMLKLYALYKQSTIGDINIAPPSDDMDFIAKAKFDAWEQVNGKPKQEAMQEYADLVSSLK